MKLLKLFMLFIFATVSLQGADKFEEDLGASTDYGQLASQQQPMQHTVNIQQPVLYHTQEPNNHCPKIALAVCCGCALFWSAAITLGLTLGSR